MDKYAQEVADVTRKAKKIRKDKHGTSEAIKMTKRHSYLVESLSLAITASNLINDAEKQKGIDTLGKLKDMWEVFGMFYHAVKYAGHQTQECIARIKELRSRFCGLFEDVCISGDREGPPKFHVAKYH